MSVYDNALRTFTKSEQKAIVGVLRDWASVSSLGPRVLANLRKERFLNRDHVRSLLQVFLNHSVSTPIDSDKLHQDYVVACRSLVLRGGNLPNKYLPQLIGRAIPPESLVNNVIAALQNRLVSRRHIEDFVNDLLTSPSPVIEGDQADWPMAYYASWVTWDETNSTNDPFSFSASGKAIEVCACLGLPRSYFGANPSLALLVYDRPTECRLFRPTIADSADHQYFEPPDPARGSAHGWTMPWPSATVSSSPKSLVLKSRPEALHLPVAFKHLRTSMLRILK